jgi:hypothetical protein
MQHGKGYFGSRRYDGFKGLDPAPHGGTPADPRNPPRPEGEAGASWARCCRCSRGAPKASLIRHAKQCLPR